MPPSAGEECQKPEAVYSGVVMPSKERSPAEAALSGFWWLASLRIRRN